MSKKSQVGYIVLNRAEGRHEECGIPHTVGNYEEANAVISKMAATIPEEKDGVTYKVDFVITFYDHETYSGTYNMKRDDIKNADLSGHIRRINDINLYPEWIQNYRRETGTEEKYQQFVKTHDLGF